MKNIAPILLVLFLFACKTPDARKPVSQSSESFIDQSIELNKELVAYEEKLIQKIINKDTVNNYLTSKNGFWYFYNQKETAPAKKPGFGDKVVFNYNISRLDGTPIYTTEELGKKTYRMDQENLFSGLRQGLKLMKVGETVTFLFPSYTAFGYYGDNKKIGVNVPIRSKVTLKKIIQHSKVKTDTLN